VQGHGQVVQRGKQEVAVVVTAGGTAFLFAGAGLFGGNSSALANKCQQYKSCKACQQHYHGGFLFHSSGVEETKLLSFS